MSVESGQPMCNTRYREGPEKGWGGLRSPRGSRTFSGSTAAWRCPLRSRSSCSCSASTSLRPECGISLSSGALLIRLTPRLLIPARHRA